MCCGTGGMGRLAGAQVDIVLCHVNECMRIFEMYVYVLQLVNMLCRSVTGGSALPEWAQRQPVRTRGRARPPWPRWCAAAGWRSPAPATAVWCVAIRVWLAVSRGRPWLPCGVFPGPVAGFKLWAPQVLVGGGGDPLGERQASVWLRYSASACYKQFVQTMQTSCM